MVDDGGYSIMADRKIQGDTEPIAARQHMLDGLRLLVTNPAYEVGILSSCFIACATFLQSSGVDFFLLDGTYYVTLNVGCGT